jgi:hypothetical protein
MLFKPGHGHSRELLQASPQESEMCPEDAIGVASLEVLADEDGVVNEGGARSQPLALHEGQWKLSSGAGTAGLGKHCAW